MKTNNKNKQNLLLKEYEIINNKTQFLENTIWKSFSVIGIISISLLLSDKIIGGKLNFEILYLLASFSIALTLIWWKIAERWWDIQSTLYIRSRHIEEDLGMFSNIYIGNRDGTYNILMKIKKERMDEIKYTYEFSRKGVQKYFSLILVIIPISWIIRLSIDPLIILQYKHCFAHPDVQLYLLFILFPILSFEIIYSFILFIKKQYLANISIKQAIFNEIKIDDNIREKTREIIDSHCPFKWLFIKHVVRKNQRKYSRIKDIKEYLSQH